MTDKEFVKSIHPNSICIKMLGISEKLDADYYCIVSNPANFDLELISSTRNVATIFKMSINTKYNIAIGKSESGAWADMKDVINFFMMEKLAS